ncbi:MAG: hypothetical protein MOB07_16210 [Acidobacteria bacterium]|nr:hypothetical protein [Acidobacteriota bacterium]
MKTNNPLAQEITAQIQLGLYGTVGKLARQLRAIDRIAPRLKEGGVVRRIEVDREARRRAVGVSAAHRKISAFGGLLYSVGALGHEVSTAGSDIIHSRQESRLDVGDMTHLEADRRLEWRTYTLVYDLLEEVFAAAEVPELILVDLPLVMGRAVYAQALAEEETDRELRAEIARLRDRVEAFWERHLPRCFPFDESGPRVVSIGRRRFGSLLRLLEKKGLEATPDPIDPEVEHLIQNEWAQVLSVGIDRVLRGILPAEHRTAAFNREEGRRDKQAFPRLLIDRGAIGFHYLTGLRGRPVQVETPGSAAAWYERGGTEALDRLAADLMALTYFDHRSALPLPLWYAREGVGVVKNPGLLEFYKRETLRAMRNEQVDQMWLAGWEEE